MWAQSDGRGGEGSSAVREGPSMVIRFLEAKGTMFTNPAVVGLIGVIIGSLLTGLLNFFTQRSADERRRLMWLRDERRQVYSEFLASWESYERAKNTLYIGPERKEVEEAYWQFLSSYNALSLIAPEEVRAAADSVRECSKSNKEDRDPDATGRFWKAARKDLGIPD